MKMARHDRCIELPQASSLRCSNEMTINLSLRRLLSHKFACKSGLTMWHLHYARTSDSP